MRILLLGAAVFALAGCDHPASDNGCRSMLPQPGNPEVVAFSCTGEAYEIAKAAYNGSHQRPIVGEVKLGDQMFATPDPNTTLFVYKGTIQTYTSPPPSPGTVAPVIVIAPEAPQK